ncbi:DUF5753 domain-containing protein [Streptomyces endophyticus]|uniref:DUF5753 domain-containing protein n=1 Tax=Streptomyces endophyticus TaxID=714166 RepID=A0ABU6F3A6_9ACTN|nr:DUF5753 domain-containing protein [Streptomyces endophyticus]MEB8338484.1 DUF5753 domain-containing protein [Streptomyces endophyticus]
MNTQRGSVYRWDIHRVAGSRHQHGPCGTSVSEDGARACVEAALTVAADPGAYAWGLLSRVRSQAPGAAGTPAAGPRTPIAWAAPGPDGTVAWLPHGATALRPAPVDRPRHIAELEQRAAVIHEFASAAVPELLRTEDYARALCATAHPLDPPLRIEQRLAAVARRRRILARREPAHLVVLLDEGVLRHRVGGERVMSGQLGHLLDSGALPRIHLRVLPFGARDHPGALPPFRILGFGEGPDVLCGESSLGAQSTVDAGRIREHRLAFRLIRSRALSWDDTRELIRELKGELDRGVPAPW